MEQLPDRITTKWMASLSNEELMVACDIASAEHEASLGFQRMDERRQARRRLDKLISACTARFETMKCSLCGKRIQPKLSHNAAPLEGRCCLNCNAKIVIPIRIYAYLSNIK